MADKVLRLNIKAISDFSDVQNNVQNIQQYLSKLKLPTNLKSNFAGIFGDLEKEMAKYQKALDSGFKTKGDITGFEKNGERISSLLNRLQKEMGKISSSSLNDAFADINLKALEEAENKVKNLGQQLKDAIKNASGFSNINKEIDDAFSKMGKSKEVDTLKTKLKEAFATNDVEKMNEVVTKLGKKLETFKNTKFKENFSEGFKEIQAAVNQINNSSSVKNLTNGLSQAKIEAQEVAQTNLDKLINEFIKATDAVGQVTEEQRKLHNETLKSKSATQGLGSELDSLKHRITYFFGLTNSVMLFHRAVTQAFNTVKELDAVMTEMAVVTDLEVGDYWKRLPEFSKNAKELGVSIKGAYEATTLYLQQGLEMNKAQEVANETLKMARIAGMEAADATDMMTAALRGFNMEINENSAQRINDVYSELAAITASNTEEIATAMTKTASIASSANMEFETTSALLAQIIETTREAPETAGTALKTVIARFQELKKAPSEIGEVEGEIIDANKVETALRSIGVALRDTSGQFRDLDDVFLEISSKWDTLGLNTQRYIATLAAGSRQQSRFLAMMSDYDRTMELVNAANNSAGASQEQYEKTLDSLETKLNQLSVAWQTFLMGLADNTAIKFFITSLTKILEGINGILNGLSGDKGLIKSILSLGMVFGGLKLGESVFNKLFASIGSAFLGKGMEAGTKFGLGLYNSISSSLIKTSAKTKKLFNKTAWFGEINTAATIKEVTKAQNKLNIATQKQAIVSERIANINNQNSIKHQLLLEQQAGVTELVTLAELERKAALKALNITEEESNYLTSKGLLGDRAAVVFSNQETAAKAREAIATNELNKEKLEELYLEANHQRLQKSGILTRAKATLALLLGGKAARLKAMQTLGLITAEQVETITTKGATAAQLGFNAALYACPIGWIIAGIGGLILLIRHLVKVIETPTEKIERLNKQLEVSKEVVEEAKTAYDNIFSSFDQYKNSQETLNGLTKGTQEWKNALFQANQQVLEMLRNYPELAKYITRGENGQLIIAEEGQQAIINKAEQTYLEAQRSYYAAELSYTKQDFEQKRLNRTLIAPGSDKLTTEDLQIVNTYTSKDFLRAANNAVATYGVDSDEYRRYEQIWMGMGYHQDDLKRLTHPTKDNVAEITKEWETYGDIQEFTQEYYNFLSESGEVALKHGADYRSKLLIATEKEAQANKEYQDRVQSFFFGSLNTGVSEELLNSGYSDEFVSLFAEKFKIEDFEEGVAKNLEKYKEVSRREDLVSMYLERTGLKELPEDLAGISETALKEILASMDYMNEISEDMNNAYAKISIMSPEKQKKILSVIKKDGQGFTQAMAEEYKKLIPTDKDGNFSRFGSVEQRRALEAALGFNLEEAADALGVKIEDFVNMILDHSEIAIESFNRITTDLKKIGLDSDLLGKLDINSGSLQLLSEELYNSFLEGGISGTNALIKTLTESLQGQPEEIQQAFFNLLNSIDWTDADAVEGLSEELQLLGIELDFGEKGIEGLEDQIKSLNNSVKKVDFEKVKEDLLSLEDIAKDLKEGKTNGTYNEAQVNNLLKTQGLKPEDFFQIGVDEWTYIGDTNTLLGSINSYTYEILKLQRSEAEEKVKKAQQAFQENVALSYNSTELAKILQSAAAGAVASNNISEFKKWALATIFKNTPEVTKSFTNNYWKEMAATYAQMKPSEIIGLIGSETYAEHRNIPYSEYLTKGDSAQGYLDKLYRDDPEDSSDGVFIGKGDYSTEWLRVAAENFGLNINPLTGKEYEGWELETAEGLVARLNKFYEETILTYADNFKFAQQNNSTITPNEEQFKYFNEPDINKIITAANSGIPEAQEALIALAKNVGLTEKAIDDLKDNGVEAWNQLGTAIKDEQIIESLGKTAENILNITKEYENLDDVFSQDIQKIGYALGFTDMSEGSAAYNFLSNKDNLALIERALSGDKESWATLMSDSEDSPYKIFANQIAKTFGSVNDYAFMYATGNMTGVADPREEEEKEVDLLDRQYNNLQDLNAEMRERERLEREYNKLLEDSSIDTSALYALSRKEIESLEEQKRLQEEILGNADKKTGRIGEAINIASSLKGYVRYDEENNKITVDYDALDALAESDSDKYEEIIDKLKELEDVSKEIDDIKNEISDIEDNVKKIKERGKEEYSSLEKRIFDALIERDNQLIEGQEKINDSIDNAASDLVGAIQTNINKLRQDRQNEETQKSISEKETRLAYLRQDTSGANTLEIKKLEEEIAKEKESYGDTLVDQALQDLQTQNDYAAEQRNKQIELMREQIEANKSNGYYAAEAVRILTETLQKGGIFREDSEFYKLITGTEDWGKKSNIEQKGMLEELKGNVESAALYTGIMAGDSVDYMELMLGHYKMNDGEVDWIIKHLNDLRNVKLAIKGDEWIKAWGQYSNKENSSNYIGDRLNALINGANPMVDDSTWKPEYATGAKSSGEPPIDDNLLMGIKDESDYMEAMIKLYKRDREITSEIWTYNHARNQKLANNPGMAEQWGIYEGPEGVAELEAYLVERLKDLERYKTGGLADFTGPAWLDGTKSRPEMVLNAQDTENFILLKDVLSSLLHLPASNTGAASTNYIDVSVQVDEISNDYDVDQMVDRVKQKIYEDGMYRNNNMINLIR